MKVNLIVLPFEENVKSPPICMGYIGALLKKDKHEVKIVDLNLGDKIGNADLNIVATTTVDYYNCPLLNIEEIDKWLTRIGKLDTKMAILGPHVTTIPEYFMKYGNYLVVGEPEETVKELVETLARGEKPKGVKGLYYKEGKKFVKNKPRELIKDLDALPFPDRSLMKIEEYINPVCKNNPHMMITSSRGCPYRCTYCYMDVYGHGWRPRSARNVIDELIEIRKKYGIKEIWFRDDLFSLDKKRVIEICDGIIKNKLDLTWSCQTRVDTLDEEVIKKMAESGCYVISLGIESGSQEMLNKMRKGITLEQVRKAVALCRKYNIRTRGYFIIGTPGETKETIAKTLDFAKSLNLDYFMLSILTPYPETTIFNEALHEGIIKEKSWEEALKNAGIINTPFTFNELVKMKRDLYMKYYFRLAYVLPRLTPGRLDILYHGFKPFIKQFFVRKFRGKKIESD